MAIAYDTSNSGVQNSNTTAVTVSMTLSASATLLLVGISVNETTTDRISGVTWAGNNMTRIANVIGAATGVQVAIYGILNPTTGTNNFVASKTVLCSMDALGVSYTGTSTSALPTIFSTNSLTASAIGSLASAVTPTVDNSWIVAMGCNNFADGMTVDGGRVIRVDDAGGSSRAMADSAGPVPTGLSNTTTFIRSGTGDWGMVAVVVEPDASVNSNPIAWSTA
jgi:hypothetical protein